MGYQFPTSTSDIDLYERFWVNAARRDYWAFRQYMHPGLKKSWWQRQVADELTQFTEDIRAGKRPILFIEAPPQHGKSVQVVDYIAWLSGQMPDLKTIYASFSERLGVRANLAIQRMHDGGKYNKVFPECRISERNSVTVSGQFLRNKEILEFLGHDGSFRNTTVNGSVTGEGLDLGVLDDPVKGREEANSPRIREKTWDWFTDDFMSRFSDEAALLGIMTRWHVDDLFGRVIDKFGDRVKVLRFPAIAEVDETHRKAGEPLMPEHKSLEFLMERKKAMHAWSWEALYQQNPVISGGNLFDESWWRYLDVAPPVDYRIIYVDTAQKEKEQNDYSVLQCWGAMRGGGIVLLDMIRGRWQAPDLLERARSFWAKHKAETGKGVLRAMKVEDKVSGTGLIQTLAREGVPVLAIPRGTDKVSRALDAAPYAESGNVSILRDVPHLSDMQGELAAFPNGKHDDTVDPLLDAVNDMLGDGLSDGRRAGVLW